MNSGKRLENIEQVAELSQGESTNKIIYEKAAFLIQEKVSERSTICDVGCGKGGFFFYLKKGVEKYIGLDIKKYPGFPKDEKCTFKQVNFDSLDSNPDFEISDFTFALEVIEHLENPRSFFRFLNKITKSKGTIIVSTPNQLSFLSKLGFVVKGQFVYFQEGRGMYPAHITALLEVDLKRIAHETGLINVNIHYSNEGRIPATGRHWPKWLSKQKSLERVLSDNIFLVAEKP